MHFDTKRDLHRLQCNDEYIGMSSQLNSISDEVDDVRSVEAVRITDVVVIFLPRVNDFYFQGSCSQLIAGLLFPRELFYVTDRLDSLSVC